MPMVTIISSQSFCMHDDVLYLWYFFWRVIRNKSKKSQHQKENTNVGTSRSFEISNSVYIADNSAYNGPEEDLTNFDYDVLN